MLPNLGQLSLKEEQCTNDVFTEAQLTQLRLNTPVPGLPYDELPDGLSEEYVDTERVGAQDLRISNDGLAAIAILSAPELRRNHPYVAAAFGQRAVWLAAKIPRWMDEKRVSGLITAVADPNAEMMRLQDFRNAVQVGQQWGFQALRPEAVIHVFFRSVLDEEKFVYLGQYSEANDLQKEIVVKVNGNEHVLENPSFKIIKVDTGKNGYNLTSRVSKAVWSRGGDISEANANLVALASALGRKDVTVSAGAKMGEVP